jgi:hypothetical protein
MSDAIVNERRWQAYAVAKRRGSTPAQQHLALLACNLFITKVNSGKEYPLLAGSRRADEDIPLGQL